MSANPGEVACSRQNVRRDFGRAAEDAAHRELLLQGYRPIGRNVRSRWGEIDVIAFDGDVLVFVEVKARRCSGDAALSSAGSAVTRDKQRRLRALAARFLAERGWPLDQKCRFDTVVVGVSQTDQAHQVRLIRDAF